MPRPTLPSSHMDAEAAAWATVLVHRHLMHAIVRVPTGQWLVQHEPHGSVQLLEGPADVLDLAATIQRQLRTARPDSR
ncbi:hypothetical protein O1M54_41105 [Streptomyces diastatochromogenes]|nr:hypothetical protein [Streptomyces diastatochromogenes]MCZ0990384.1 hypothetical protein [Streptomyces diastatochromogenes]